MDAMSLIRAILASRRGGAETNAGFGRSSFVPVDATKPLLSGTGGQVGATQVRDFNAPGADFGRGPPAAVPSMNFPAAAQSVGPGAYSMGPTHGGDSGDTTPMGPLPGAPSIPEALPQGAALPPQAGGPVAPVTVPQENLYASASPVASPTGIDTFQQARGEADMMQRSRMLQQMILERLQQSRGVDYNPFPQHPNTLFPEKYR